VNERNNAPSLHDQHWPEATVWLETPRKRHTQPVHALLKEMKLFSYTFICKIHSRNGNIVYDTVLLKKAMPLATNSSTGRVQDVCSRVQLPAQYSTQLFVQHVSADLCQPQPPMPTISCTRRPRRPSHKNSLLRPS